MNRTVTLDGWEVDLICEALELLADQLKPGGSTATRCEILLRKFEAGDWDVSV